MELFLRCSRLVAWLVAFAFSAGASAQITVGKDYRPIDPPQPVSSGKQIELIEFFDYGCPHCNVLQGPLRVWLKRKPADVEFLREPVVFRDSQLPLTTTYHAFEAMGLTHKLHYDLFAAIHEKRTLDTRALLRSPNPIYDWVATQGVDRKTFVDVYNSFGVSSRVKRSIEMTRSYDIPGTPALTVDGKYLTAPSLTLKADNSVDYGRFFRVLDQLIVMARKERAGK